MIFELGALMASAYYPINFIFFSPNVGELTSTYSALGLGLDVRYYLDPKIFVGADYEINFGARTKTILLHGFGIQSGYYFLGGAGSSLRRSNITATSTPAYSLYGFGGISQHSYDITSNTGKNSRQVTVSKNKYLPNTGDFSSFSMGGGYEHNFAIPAFRLGFEAGIQTSLATSGPVSVTMLNFRIQCSYQL